MLGLSERRKQVSQGGRKGVWVWVRGGRARYGRRETETGILYSRVDLYYGWLMIIKRLVLPWLSVVSEINDLIFHISYPFLFILINYSIPHLRIFPRSGP